MTAADVAAAPPRVRYHFLDGIRGLAAFYVLLFHSLTITLPQEDEPLSFVMRSLRSIFGYGHFAVAVFIVLSGFSLMLPLAKDPDAELKRGFGPYLKRRCRRVMPPYYAALALSILAILAAGLVPGASTSARDEALSPGSVISHLFLIHNLNFDWVFRINGPMWSVATEFQIYFLFPLVLLPLWRRIGAPATIALAWLSAYALHYGLPSGSNFSWAAPWFVGSFALGMWASTVGVVGGIRHHLASKVAWGWVTLASLTALVAILATSGTSIGLPLLDLLVTVGATAGILYCMRRHEVDPATGSAWNNVLGSQRLVALGAFSYSLYLLQHPMLRLTEALISELPLSYESALWVQFIVGTPFIVAVSRLFAEFFEMPFTTGSPLLQAVQSRARRNQPAQVNR